MKNHENKQMENGDPDTGKYPHRNCNNTRYDIMHGVKTASPPTPPLKGSFFLVSKGFTSYNFRFLQCESELSYDSCDRKLE